MLSQKLDLIKKMDKQSKDYLANLDEFCAKMEKPVAGNAFPSAAYVLGQKIITGSSGLSIGAISAYDSLLPSVVNWDILACEASRNFRSYVLGLYSQAYDMSMRYLNHKDPDSSLKSDLQRQLGAVKTVIDSNPIQRRTDGKMYNYVINKTFNADDFFQCKRGDVSRVYCNNAFKQFFDCECHAESDSQRYSRDNLAVRFAANSYCSINGVWVGGKLFTYISVDHMTEMIRRVKGRKSTIKQEFIDIGLSVPTSSTNWLVIGDDCWKSTCSDDSWRIADYEICVNVVDITTNEIKVAKPIRHRAVYYLFKEWKVTNDDYVEDLFVFLLPDADYFSARASYSNESCVWGFTAKDGSLYVKKATHLLINGNGAKEKNILR